MTKPTTDARPPYQRVADVLRQEIKSGRLKPGEQMPSHRELQERFEIANMTARSALRVLREEGLVYTVQGRGSYVMDREGAADGGSVNHAPPAWWTASQDTPSLKGAAEAEQEAPQDASLTEVLRGVVGQLDALTSEMGDLRHQVSQLRGKVEELERQDGR
ncbi:GntR family transcriptional regulator [Streptomyces sp. Je 1-369]|uniref:GntR family transcriptional regulator n=1 Tax=Streptomyces sp. Je 1-369 TaxID=2966192 RepID=UPI00228573F8|nr:GntR family transcriptional regulator [Streptomyces sp. Je 1-369]WAL96538.1 GntR family transcriptional regulator [Streptomyces sp. Je 1-369]